MSSEAATGQLDLGDMRRRVKAVFIGSCGNLVEWYDFYAYTAFSLYFASSFFPKDNELVQQLNAQILFAVGFIARPFGGWLFGFLADRYGRRNSLMISVLMMCFGSLMIAVAPTYATAGIWAPALLGLARVIQGLSLGGEYGASATYLSEVADPKRRGFYSSFQYVTLIGGQLTAILVLMILQKLVLSPEELKQWGWRIPFAIGALLSIFAAVMRSNLHETTAFELARNAVKRPPIFGFLRYPKEVALVIGLTIGGTAAFYTFTTYMQILLKQTVKLNDDTTTLVTAGTLIFALLLQPLYGAISDRIGRKWLLMFFGVAGTLLTVPLLTALQATRDPLIALLLICAAWIYVAGYTSINAIVKAELFPTSVRATGVGFPYALTVSIFGGTTAPIALKFKDAGLEGGFNWYLTACIAVSLLVYLTMRDTKKHSAMERHE
jgi:MHS family alpha-ketoglutarate permease-like MFS transporter